MANKELKNLRRTDLLEMLIESEKLRAEAAKKYEQIEAELQERIAEMTEQLNTRNIDIADSGNLADACLKLNGVLDSAQNAADQYLENITQRHQHIDEECEKRISSAQDIAMAILEETRQKCQMLEQKAYDASFEIIRQAQERCKEIEAQGELKLQEVEKDCELLRRQTRFECEQLKADAQRSADAYFEEKNGKIQQVLDAYGAVEAIIKKD